MYSIVNLIGRILTSLCALFFIPFYLKYLGIEAYGVVALFTLFLTLSNMFDGGLAIVLNRQFGRGVSNMPTLLHTFEVVYWSISLLIGILLFSFNKPLGFLGCVAIIVQCPFALYWSGLVGLNKQLLHNTILVCSSLIRGLGALLALKFSPTITAFFTWQIASGLIQTLITRHLLKQIMPPQDQPVAFDFSRIREIGHFWIGLSCNHALTLLLFQLDKVVISQLASLATFGKYQLASSLAGGLVLLSGSFFAALFPRFSKLVEAGETEKLKQLYTHSAQRIAFLIFPLAALMIVFPAEILFLWTRDLSLAQQTARILPPLAVAATCSSLLTMPYNLQLACGKTRLAILQNGISLVVALPLLFWLGVHHGGVGVAWGWFAQSATALCVALPLTHQKLLPTLEKKWAIGALLIPFCAALAIAVLIRLLAPTPTGTWSALCLLTLVGLGILTSSIYIRRRFT